MKASFKFGGISITASSIESGTNEESKTLTGSCEIKEVSAGAEYTPEEFNSMMETNAKTFLTTLDKVPECIGKMADTFFETYKKVKDMDL